MVSNYRPNVNCAGYIIKMLEKMLYTNLYDFVTQKNILITDQFEFIGKSHSTDFAILLYYMTVTHAYDALSNKEHCVGVICIAGIIFTFFF